MSARFTFTQSGIDHFISSPEKNEDRDFILDYLRKSHCISMSVSELDNTIDMDKKQITKKIYHMLKHGWMSSINESENKSSDSEVFENFSLDTQLAELSISHSAMLVDMSGLIIASSGFSTIDCDYLAASATALALINDITQSRNKELCNNTPWSLNMNWGELKVMTQLVCIGPLKFVLITGDHSDLNVQALIKLIAMLARRYISG
ncbi:MAG: hypothetical protein OEY29_08015 [Gammaproteobacteria bacterium]|nr:hypothetical protein [Gammaproteobacteria bacterium]